VVENQTTGQSRMEKKWNKSNRIISHKGESYFGSVFFFRWNISVIFRWDILVTETSRWFVSQLYQNSPKKCFL